MNEELLKLREQEEDAYSKISGLREEHAKLC